MFRFVLLLLTLPALAQDFDHLLQTYAADQHFMGSVLVARGSQVLFSKGYGFANLEWRIPNDPATKFRIGSITKQFTAAAILLLEERGKLTLDDPVKKHLPDAPAAWGKITLRHLLTHTSGIPDFTGLPDYPKLQTLETTPEELVSRFRNEPLDFEPGSQFSYSNSGYVLLTELIEKISGSSYEDFIRANLLAPAGMHDTGYDSNSAVISHRAAGYDYTDSGFTNAAFIHMSIPQGAGGLYSTTEDLLKWTQALFGGNLLKPESLAKITKPFLNNYALGLFVEAGSNRRAIRHGGGIEGFNADLAYYPDDQVTVAVLANVEPDGPDAEALANDLAALLHGGSKQPGAVFSGALERVRQGSISVRLADGMLVEAMLPPSADLSAAAIASRYHLADHVQIECARTRTIRDDPWDPEAQLHMRFTVKKIQLVRGATRQEQTGESAQLSWRAGPNLLRLPGSTAATTSAPAKAAVADIERMRQVSLDRVSKMPDFVADEMIHRYRSDGVGEKWKLTDTFESEVTVNDDRISRRNIRRNGKPWKQPTAPGRVWEGFFGVELGLLDAECGAKFDFLGNVAAGGKQLRAFRFSAAPGGCLRVGVNGKVFKPEMLGRLLVDPARAEVVHCEFEGVGFPEKFGADDFYQAGSWDYVTIGGSTYLVPVGAREIVVAANGTLFLSTVAYRNHRHFEAAANITYNPGK